MHRIASFGSTGPKQGAPGLDSLLSIVQMPGGIPVATLAIGTAGAKNAGLLAVRILATSDERLKLSMKKFMDDQTAAVLSDSML